MRTLEEYVNLPWFTTAAPDELDGQACVIACNPELGAVIGMGATRLEAERDLTNARRAVLRLMLELGEDIPLPSASAPPTLTIETYTQSGRTQTHAALTTASFVSA